MADGVYRIGWLLCGTAGCGGVFIDGRYRTQVKAQVAEVFTPVPWPEVSLADWLKDQLPEGGVVGFDPILHTPGQMDLLVEALAGSRIELRRSENMVDRVWENQPAAPMGKVAAHPERFAGESHAAKRQRLAADLRAAGQKAAVITLPDSHNWLLNIRGQDIPRNPVAHGFAVLHDDARVDLFMAAEKLADVADHLGPEVVQHDPAGLPDTLRALEGPVRLDRQSAPVLFADLLGDRAQAGMTPVPCPKPARMTPRLPARRRRTCAMARQWRSCSPGWMRSLPARSQKHRWCGSWKVCGAGIRPYVTSALRRSRAAGRMGRSSITG